MIRNVVLIEFQAGASPEQIDQLLSALRTTTYAGMAGVTVGLDAGLRDGNMSLAIVNDFVDEAAYRAYDADPEHNRIRRELVAPIAQRVARCQIRT